MPIRLPSRPAPRTLMHRLDAHAKTKPDAIAFRFLRGGGGFETDDLSHAALRQRALHVAHALRERHAEGNRVLLVLHPGLDYIASFLGCLYAGAIAVPIYPPRRNRLLDRFATVARDSAARFAIAAPEVRREIETTVAPGVARALIWLEPRPTADRPVPADWSLPYADHDTPAFLQYTSGSTAEPRGVVVTHGSLEHNLELIAEPFDLSTDQVIGLSWLPPFHDLGLIGNILASVHHGVPSVLMAPQTFLSDPLFWLRAISHFRATSSAAPNFAYDLCAARATPEAIAALDLRSWKTAFNGAEPVLAATMERFARTFAPCGFSAAALCPGYGLAEATLVVSAQRRGRGAAIRHFDRDALARHQVRPTDPGAPGGVPRVGSGEVLGGQDVRSVDPDTGRELPAGAVGEIWVAGPSVARGYWAQPGLNRELFQAHLAGSGAGPFLRTGDLGFIHEGQLFITGRLKDLIILGGANHYPQDIELSVRQAHPALHDAAGAAFSVLDENGGESLAVVHEINLNHRSFNADDVLAALRETVAREHQLAVTHCALVRFTTLPKTSSGKIQRRRARELFLAGRLDSYFSTGSKGAVPVSPTVSSNSLPLPAGEFDRLHAAVARALGIAPAALDPEKPLLQQGLSSLRAVELQLMLEQEFGCTLGYEDFFEPWSVRRLGALIAEKRAVTSAAGPGR